MSNNLTFLLFPVGVGGHLYAFLTIAEQLRDRGHKVVFAIDCKLKGKLESQGFVEECYFASAEDAAKVESGHLLTDERADWISVLGPVLLPMSPEQQINFLVAPGYQNLLTQMKYVEPRFTEIIKNIRPDMIIVDVNVHHPSLSYLGIPWVFLNSINPIGISSKNVPPMLSGYATDGDRTAWRKFEKSYREACKEVYEDSKKWVLEKGGPELKYHQLFQVKYSPFANIYMYPSELDYTMFRPNPLNWHRFDALVRSSNETFEVPPELHDRPGKLIYFSLGTIGSSELGLMRRLIGIMAKSPNRFIVSQGPFSEQLILPDNMWGAAYVPQTKVIPLVDLVITHGGNNTITESFYYGKKVLVLPLFYDQFDNGQRVFETGMGLQFHPYRAAEGELLSAIEILLNNDLLEIRMRTMSKRIQLSDSQVRAADLVVKIAKQHKRVHVE